MSFYSEQPFLALLKKTSRLNLISNANTTEQTYPKIEWTYNWIYVKSPSYYVTTPSIINSEVSWSWLILDSDNIKSQIITWWDNLPNISTWWLDINLSIYDWWTITENSTNEEKIALMDIFKWAYTWSTLASQPLYSDILSTTSTWEIVTLIDNIILNRINLSTTTSTDNTPFSIWEFAISEIFWWINNWIEVDWSTISGYLESETLWWICLNSECGSTVTRDISTWNLSGYASSETFWWIDMSQVNISDTWEITWYWENELLWWISFN